MFSRGFLRRQFAIFCVRSRSCGTQPGPRQDPKNKRERLIPHMRSIRHAYALPPMLRSYFRLQRHSGHGWTCYCRDPVAIDPSRTSAIRFCMPPRGSGRLRHSASRENSMLRDIQRSVRQIAHRREIIADLFWCDLDHLYSDHLLRRINPELRPPNSTPAKTAG